MGACRGRAGGSMKLRSLRSLVTRRLPLDTVDCCAMGESAVRGLIRLLVTVGVLAAVYFLIISPILDTTNETIDRAFDASSGFQESINESLEEAGIDEIPNFDTQGTNKALDQAIANAPDKRTKQLLTCIQRADGDVDAISTCQQRYTR
jgi:predicted PurR-regulated permease PerM